MSKPQPDFTMDDLVAQIQEAFAVTDEGLTMREICKKLGLSTTKTHMSRVRTYVFDLVALGEVEYAGKKEMTTIDGARRRVAAYKRMSEEENDDEE